MVGAVIGVEIVAAGTWIAIISVAVGAAAAVGTGVVGGITDGLNPGKHSFQDAAAVL